MSFFATIHPGDFSHAFILTPIDQNFTAAISSNSTVGAGPSFRLGGGQVFIVGEVVSQCFCPTNPVITTLPPDADPPFPPVYPYLFNTGDIYGRDNLSLNLVMVREDDYEFDATAILNGNPVNLTGCDLKMTAKWNPYDSDVQAVFQIGIGSGITITSATLGTFHVKIAHALTESLPIHTVYLPYDIQLVDPAGNIRTLTLGTLKVVPDITLSLT